MTYFWITFMGLLVFSVILTAILEKVLANRPKRSAKLDAPMPDAMMETPVTETPVMEEIDEPTETTTEDETLAPIE